TFKYINSLNSYGNSFEDYFDGYYDYYDDYYDDYFENFGDYGNGEYNYENPIDGFDFDSKVTDTAIVNSAENSGLVTSRLASIFPILVGVGGFMTLLGVFLGPLLVTLVGMYVSLVRRNANLKFDFGTEFSNIFKNTFNDTYFKKLVGNLLVGVITIALSLLLIVPGVIFIFSAYFTFQIMNDYPNLKPSEAIKLSRKIVSGNRTELFTYELSFIPWYLLVGITFGLANIYVIPYKSTCDALYYENFRLRALAEGRIVEDDFLSADERFMKYNSMNAENPYQAQQNGYYATAGAPNMDVQSRQEQMYKATEQYVANNCTFFTPDFRPIDPFVQYNPYANPYGNPYQQYQQPNGGYYNPPQQQPPYQQDTAASSQYTQYYAQPPVQQEVPNTNSAYTQPKQHSYADSIPVQPQEAKPEENVSVQNDMSTETSDNVPEFPQMPETPSADYPSAEHTETQENAPNYCEPPQSADSFSENDNNEQY
ncbi:MAG: DUF975 family protein, partial [Eubacterium sp.]|nr:DUF975 family protein [Eubacterium sp.]